MAGLTPAQYTELLAATMENIEASPVDQVLTQHPTLDLFKQHATNLTGESLRLNLESGEEDDAVFTDKSGTFSTAVSPDVLSVAKFEHSAPLVAKTRIKWYDLQQNTGKEAIVNMLELHAQAAQKKTAKKIAQQLHVRYGADGVPANVGTNLGPFHSLDGIVSDAAYDADPNGAVAGATPFTVGGIDTSVAANAFWQAQRIEVAKDSGVSIRKAFRKVRNELAVSTSGQADVTHIIAGRDIFEELEDSFDDKVRYHEFGDGQTRFRAIMDGDIEVRLDPDCPPKRAYFLDINSWKLGYLNNNFLKVQEPQKITGTLDFVTPIATVLTVGTNQRRSNAVLLRPATAGGDA